LPLIVRRKLPVGRFDISEKEEMKSMVSEWFSNANFTDCSGVGRVWP
jgi:hypothetical protein